MLSHGLYSLVTIIPSNFSSGVLLASGSSSGMSFSVTIDYILIKANSIFHLYRLPDNSIGKNHIQSSSSFSQNCSFCLLWIWYFPNELYHMQIEFTNICSTYFQKIVRLAHHWSNENATHSFSKLYPYVFPVTFQKYLKRDCFQPLNFCKFPYRYEQHDNLCPGYL